MAIAEGNTVAIKATGDTGTVLSLETVRTGTRGRPPIVANVKTSEGETVQLPIKELRLVSA